MANQEQDDPVIAAAKIQAAVTRQERRGIIHSEAVKGLFLINGGGAVALLAFLQAVWMDATGLVPWILGGLLPLILGLIFAAVANYIRAESALRWESWFTFTDKKQRREGERLGDLHLRLAGLSIYCFGLAMITVIIGGAINAPSGALTLVGPLLVLLFGIGAGVYIWVRKPHLLKRLVGLKAPDRDNV